MVFFLGLGCTAGGFIALMPLLGVRYPRLKVLEEKLGPYTFLIGLAVLFIGVIGFLAPYHVRGLSPFIPFFGDLIPSSLAILLGALISIEFIESLKGVKGKFTERAKELLHRYRIPIGFCGMVFGILHWFLFRVVFF
jgi:hypothetical protein